MGHSSEYLSIWIFYLNSHTILYIHGHFKLTQWAWAACGRTNISDALSKLNCRVPCGDYLQYSSKMFERFFVFALSQCQFGYYSRLSAPKYAWLNFGEGEGHISVSTKGWRVNVRNFRENSRETASVSAIRDENCRPYSWFKRVSLTYKSTRSLIFGIVVSTLELSFIISYS